MSRHSVSSTERQLGLFGTRDSRGRLLLALLTVVTLTVSANVARAGEIWAWGFDGSGAVSGVPPGTGFTAIAGGYDFGYALATDGSIAAWGLDDYGQVSSRPTGTGFTAIAAGYEHGYALTADGAIVAWGDDWYGQVSNTPTGTGFTVIAAGYDHGYALTANGSIAAWGKDYSGQVSNAPTGSGYTAIAGGGGHGYALAADGSIVAWGLDDYGQVSNTPKGVGFKAIAAGYAQGYALAADGSIAAWGADTYGMVSGAPAGTGFTAIEVGRYHCYALAADRTIAAWGSSGPQVAETPTEPGFTAIAAGSHHGYALASVSETWTDLGGGTFGSAGQPTLGGSGTLDGGTLCTLTLTNAPPFELIVAWFSYAPSPYWLYGGTVWAYPYQNQQLFLADATGAFHGTSTWPDGLPPDTKVWFQFYVRDPATFHGMCMSNGLLATTPGDVSFPPGLEMERISVSSGGGQVLGGGLFDAPMSADGRYVVFESDSSYLVPDDTNQMRDVFLRDRHADLTERMSVDSLGKQCSNVSFSPTISADGRYVAFTSWADDLVTGDTNTFADVFVRDRQSGVTERVSVDSSGAEGDAGSYAPSISADGRFVAFSSQATNLVSGDINGSTDVFLRDRQAGSTVLISVSSSGAQGDSYSFDPSISADGRMIAFQSDASNLVAGDTNWVDDLFVHDRLSGQTQLVSVSTSGGHSDDYSDLPSISADGRFVGFQSDATNLVPNDTNGVSDAFVRDLVLGATRRVSVSSTGAQSNNSTGGALLSGDGRFAAFPSMASNLVLSDTNGSFDAFVHDLQTGETIRVSVSAAGVEGNNHSGSPAISADGHYVTMESEATNLVAGDTNGWRDIFAAPNPLGP